VTLHVPPEGGGHRGRQRDVPLLVAFERGEDHDAPDQLDLSGHPKNVTVELRGVLGQTDDLALSETATAAYVDHGSVALWQGVVHRTHLGRKPGHDSGGRDGGRADGRSRARVAGEAAVIHGGRQHRTDVGVDIAGVGAAYRVVLQVTNELADADRGRLPAQTSMPGACSTSV
jgi:hypothetical protein